MTNKFEIKRKPIAFGNINCKIVVIANSDEIEELALILRLNRVSVDCLYKIIPHQGQDFCCILTDLEIPPNQIDFYTNNLRNGKNLLVIDTDESNTKQIESVFDYLGIKEWDTYYTSKYIHPITSSFDKVWSS